MATKRYVVLLSIIMCMVGTKTMAYDIAVANAGVTIYYNYINDGTELAVTMPPSNRPYSGSVIIPEEVTYMNRTRKVTRIASYAFYGCGYLTSVTIPNSVTSIGEVAFYSCIGMTSITIGNSVAKIENDAFYNCGNLTSVHISDLNAWCKIVFISHPSAQHLILNGKEIKDLIIPNSVTSIGNRAFQGFSGLTSVTIPNNVTSIGEQAFRGCSGLTSVTIPNGVTNIGVSAFQGCSSLTSITIPNSVTSIGKTAFSDCNFLVVTSMIENPLAITTNTFSDNTFYNATLYVPSGTFDKYKATEGWTKFLFIEEEEGRKKCEKPTISFKDGKLTFSCATEGVTYQYNVSTSIKSGEGNNIDFTPKYIITAYATKEGYDNSETATLEISIGDANCDGNINAADITTIVNIIMQQK